MDAFRSQPDKRLDALLVDGLHLSETVCRLSLTTLPIPPLSSTAAQVSLRLMLRLV